MYVENSGIRRGPLVLVTSQKVLEKQSFLTDRQYYKKNEKNFPFSLAANLRIN